MPKEVIGRRLQPEVRVSGSTDGPTTETQYDFAVEVGWGRESGTVQIGSVNYEAEPYSIERGIFVDLNRDDINQLIKTLRKARDQAYGADE